MEESKEQLPKIRYPVFIEIVENGWLVNVGCKKFVSTDIDQLISELKSYLVGDYTKLSLQYKSLLAPAIPMTMAVASLSGVGASLSGVGAGLPGIGQTGICEATNAPLR